MQQLFIGCSEDILNISVKHYAQAIPTEDLDIKYLYSLVGYGVNKIHDKCIYVGNQLDRRITCGMYMVGICGAWAQSILGFDHTQGTGTIRSAKCNAKIDIYLAADLKRFPYICIVTRGSHSHFPPFPTRIPSDIYADIQQAIVDSELLTLTSSIVPAYTACIHRLILNIERFLSSPQHQYLCRAYGAHMLAEVHRSLNNEDRIGAIIKKERLLRYPFGTDIAGIINAYTPHMLLIYSRCST